MHCGNDRKCGVPVTESDGAMPVQTVYRQRKCSCPTADGLVQRASLLAAVVLLQHRQLGQAAGE